MKLLQLLPELNEGGVERGVVELNREFVAAGVDSHVASKGGRLVARIELDGGHHHEINICDKNLLTAPWRVRELRRLLQRLKPDVIHARSRYPAWLARFANRHMRIPFVTTVHGLNSINAYSRIMSTGDQVICVSEVVRDRIVENYAVDPSRITVIQRGVDTRLFDPAASDLGFIDDFRTQHQLAGAFVVTSVGRVTWLKDYESFIRAIAICAAAIPRIRGLIVGGVREDKRDYLESLRDLAAQLGVADRVHFVGNQQKIAEIYQLSDVVVNASLKMGNVGRTVVEALAMDTPVIATSYPGLNNLVRDGVNGYIVDVQDPNGLAERIQRLHQAPIAATRSTIPAEFTLDAMVSQTLAVYRKLLTESQDRR